MKAHVIRQQVEGSYSKGMNNKKKRTIFTFHFLTMIFKQLNPTRFITAYQIGRNDKFTPLDKLNPARFITAYQVGRKARHDKFCST